MEETDAIPISALQHWLFCPRQCCLIHVEQLWQENRFTAEGRLLHERTDTPGAERRGSVHTVRALPLASEHMNLFGVADVVEFHDGAAFPVEYKRGRPKAHRADEVQLCAQAMCLEEMLQCYIPQGALFYGKIRRRTEVKFDSELRALTATVVREVHAAISAGLLPAPVYEHKRCGHCSLADICKPRRLAKPPPVAAWMQRQLEADSDK